MSRSTIYLHSLTSRNFHGVVNFYKLGQIAAYIEGLEQALVLVQECDDNCGKDQRRPLPPYLRVKIDAALAEPEI